ncbi:MAG: hypothetical protein IJV70_07305 [Clostridia bacterium]|nr:hypothetical protein [Clostridia bacterium]
MMILYSYTTSSGMWLGTPEKNVEERIQDYRENNNVTGVFGMVADNCYVPLQSAADLDALKFAIINNGEGETFSLTGLSILTEKELVSNFVLSAPKQEMMDASSAEDVDTEDEDEDFEEADEDFEEELPDGKYRCAWCHATFTDRDLEDPNCPAVVGYNGHDFCSFDHVTEFMFNQ